jgi:hypothetical protein
VENFARIGYAINAVRGRSFAAVRIGRLVEVRVEQLNDCAEVEALNVAVACALRCCAPRAVVCANLRGAAPLVGEMAGVWAHAMRQANGAIDRSALLLDPSNTIFNLQMERIVRCANNELRRLFKEPEEVCAWLDVGLTDAERNSLRTLLNLSSVRGNGRAESLSAAAAASEVHA